MALFRYPNSMIWWYDFRFNGQRYRASTKSRSRLVAEQAEKARRRQAEENFNQIPKRQAPRTLAVAAEEFLHLKRNKLGDSAGLEILRKCLNAHVMPVLGRKFVHEITATDIGSFQQQRLSQGASPTTVNLDVAALRGVLRRHRLWENLRQDVQKLKQPDTPGVCLDDKQRRALLRACKKSRALSLFPIVQLASCTGMRTSEIRNLRWGHIDFVSKVLVVDVSKTAAGRHRRISSEHRCNGSLTELGEEISRSQTRTFCFPARAIRGDRKQVHQTEAEGLRRRSHTTTPDMEDGFSNGAETCRCKASFS